MFLSLLIALFAGTVFFMATKATQGGGPAVSTSIVNDNTNNGNHYGSTPIPERTKEPGNDTSTTNNTNDPSKPKKKP